MKKLWLALLVAMMVFVMAGCGSSEKSTAAPKSDVAAQKITVSAAASMQDALNEITENFVKEKHLNRDQIAINYAGSGTLRQQIEQGAPSAVFISANQKHMKALQDKNIVSEVKPLVENSLVLIVPKGKTAYTFENLTAAKHISIGTPESVPAGQYAKQTLTALKLWELLQPNIVYAKDVRAVLAQVSQAAVDAGLVYKTDAMTQKDSVVITATAPVDSHVAIVYPMALVTKNANDLAKEYYAYLSTPKAAQILEKYGFTVSK